MPIIPCTDFRDGEPCPWATADLADEQAVKVLEHHLAAYHPRVTSVPAKQEKAKLPQLQMSGDFVTESALGMFRQQLASYKRLAIPHAHLFI